MKKILVIAGNPRKDSFGSQLAEQYIAGAKKSGYEVKCIHIADLKLEQFLYDNHKEKTVLPQHLIDVQNQIAEASHLVFAFPIWWGVPPAMFNLFIETIFASGFAFKFHPPKGHTAKWDKLLVNKTARLLVTLDSPAWVFKWIIGEPAYKMMKNSVLEFCGVHPVKKHYFGSATTSSNEQRVQWLKEAYSIGLKEA